MATSLPTRFPTATDQLSAVRALAKLMDAAVVIPGTNVRFGLDSLIGLIPGIGDAVGTLISSYIVLVAGQAGVPKAVIGRMLLNMGVDAVVGAVPLVGDLFDVRWKANLKNVALLEQSLADPKAARRSSTWALVGLGAVLAGVVVGLTALTWFLLQYLAGRT